MFCDQPFTGVGLDRFGAYFHQYRTNEDATNVLFNTITDNAHNVPLHLLGTGGILVFLSYLSLMVLVAVYGYKALNITQGNDRMRVGLALAIWSAYQVQSLISIDQLGIAIWNWVFAGVILGYFFTNSQGEENQKRPKKYGESPISRVAVRGSTAFVLVISVFVFLAPQWKSEVQLRLGLAVQNDPNDPAALVNAMTYPVLNGFLENSYYFEMGARKLLAYGLAEEGQEFALKTIQLDPRNYAAWSGIADLGELNNQRTAAIPYRLKTTELDPNNPNVWVQLMRDYKAAGEFKQARAAGERAIPLVTGFSMSIFKYDAETIKRELAEIPTS
jgi:tetratricopeptide (TPR) repeat protein